MAATKNLAHFRPRTQPKRHAAPHSSCAALGATRATEHPGHIVVDGPCRNTADGYVMDVPLCWLHRRMLLDGRPVSFQGWAKTACVGLQRLRIEPIPVLGRGGKPTP